MKEWRIPFECVFMDTGWEADETYAYLRGPLTKALGPIVEIKAEKQMEALILEKGMFPSRLTRWCTSKLKLEVMQKHIERRVDQGDDVVNAVGIRREESDARADAAEWEWQKDFGCEVWRPLVDWSLQDVIDIHARHGLAPNPLYLRGLGRVGCFPCIFAKKDEIRILAEMSPARIERIRELESRIVPISRARYERDRKEWEEHPESRPPDGSDDWTATHNRLFVWPFQSPTFFQSKAKDELGRYPFLTIDQAVAWSRTSRGGKQFEMFAAAGRDQGCMRWGLCDTGSHAKTKDD